MVLDNEKLIHVRTVPAPATARPLPQKPFVQSMDEYREMYRRSIEDPAGFFGEQARDCLQWSRPFDTVFYGPSDFSDSTAWFLHGELNASVNCVERHALKNPNKVALIYEADEPGHGYSLTYGELLAKICQTAQLLQSLGVKKGDVVTIYLPMVPEVVIAMMAVTRIGATHSCVFAGFSPNALRERIEDAKSRVLFTTDQSFRATKLIETKNIVDKALKDLPLVEHVIVVERTGLGSFVPGRDIKFHDVLPKFKPYCPAVPVDSEHPIFLLYTSGSTGRPKGIVHATAGYLLGAMLTTRHIFGLSSEDILFTAGDVGWITGHTYAVYGPLLNGATTIIFESTPVYPTHTRYWDIVDKYKVTQFYVAPTALRLLHQYDHSDIDQYDLSTLRALGSVGEPIAEEIWEWYFKVIGRERCSICDTYWLTESGSVIMTSLAGITPMKPGATGLPFFGIKPAIIDPTSGKEITARPAEGVLAVKQPWPSMVRSIQNDHERFKDTYLKPYPGYFFTGDGAEMDSENFIFINGRIDDVVNVSGHRLSSAEVEACFLEGKVDSRPMVCESAVVGIEDEATGQALIAFVVLEEWLREEIGQGRYTESEMAKEAITVVRSEIGPFAAPRRVYIVSDLPKTRSGKIMRRVLRKIVSNEVDQLGEVPSLSNPEVIDSIVRVVFPRK